MGKTAGTDTLTPTESEFFTDEQGATTVLVRVPDSSSNAALIHVPGLHKTGEFFPIPVGKEYPFRLLHMGIKKILGKGDGGDAEVEFGVIAKTGPEF